MPAFKTVNVGDSAFGGYEYLARSNGVIVNIQERGPRAESFKTKATMTQAEWDKYSEDNGLDSWFRVDPALLARLIDA